MNKIDPNPLRIPATPIRAGRNSDPVKMIMGQKEKLNTAQLRQAQIHFSAIPLKTLAQKIKEERSLGDKILGIDLTDFKDPGIILKFGESTISMPVSDLKQYQRFLMVSSLLQKIVEKEPIVGVMIMRNVKNMNLSKRSNEELICFADINGTPQLELSVEEILLYRYLLSMYSYLKPWELIAKQDLPFLSYLKHLDLADYTEFTDSGLAAILAISPQLTSINLSNTQITDAGLLTLISYSGQITEIDLAYCQKITNEGVLNLKECCDRLTLLNLHGCKNVTETCKELVATSINKQN